MSLIGLLIFVLIVGVIIWAIGLIPLPTPFRQIAYVIVAIIVLIYLLDALGFVGPSLRLH